MKKIALILAVVLAASIFVTACSPAPASQAPASSRPASSTAPAPTPAAPGANPPAAGSNDKAPVTMRMTWWGSDNRHQRTENAAALFMEQNPWVTIEPEYSAWDAYWERLATQIAGNNLADVFQQDFQYIVQYERNGIMYDLTPFIGPGKAFDSTHIDEGSIMGGAVGGKVYAISLGLNSQGVVWDPALFDKAGVPHPPARWTWPEYMDTIRKLHAALGIYGEEHFTVSHYHGPNLWMRQHGFSIYNEEGTGLGYTDDALLAQYWDMDRVLVSEGAVASAAIRDDIQSIENSLIVTEGSAMYGSIGGSNQLTAIVNAAGRPLKLATLPHIPGEPSGQFLKPSQYFSVYSQTSIIEECVMWLDFVSNSREANDILGGERGVPISSDIRAHLEPNLDETQKEIYRYIGHVATFSHPIGVPEPSAHAELDVIIRGLRAEVISGRISSAEGAARYRSEAERVFAAQ